MKRRLKTKQQLLDSGYIKDDDFLCKVDHVNIGPCEIKLLGQEVEIIKEDSDGDLWFMVGKVATFLSPDAFLQEETFRGPGVSINESEMNDLILGLDTYKLEDKTPTISSRIKALEEELANLKQELGI